MRRAPFIVPESEVLANLAGGNRMMRAERDARSDRPARRERGVMTLAAMPAEPPTPEPCRDEDPEIFFPYASPDEGEHSYPLKQAEAEMMLEQARQVCGRCSVAAACLQGALERDERYGVWAGHDFKSAETRNHLKRTGRQRSA
jgi:WhiB family redox-sensing transcriptional regulator